MSRKSPKIAALVDGLRGRGLDARYLGYFECFNRGQYYEAHDVLEELWLEDRRVPNGDFYKGLIQFAGAFVHLKNHLSPEFRRPLPRLRPAAALLKLARANLAKYPLRHERLDLGAVLALVEEWLGRLEAGRFEANPLTAASAPRLGLTVA